MKLAKLFEGPANAWAGLNERERRFVGLLGLVVALFVTVLPLYLLGASISRTEDQNDEIRQLLADIAELQPVLEERRQARDAARARYERPPPALRAFVTELASRSELELRDVTPQPEKVADGFTRRHLRASVRNQGLQSIVQLMAEIDNTDYPIATTRLKLEHPRSGDRYNLSIDVMSYEREGARTADERSDEPDDSRAGPPDPV